MVPELARHPTKVAQLSSGDVVQPEAEPRGDLCARGAGKEQGFWSFLWKGWEEVGWRTDSSMRRKSKRERAGQDFGRACWTLCLCRN